MGESTRPPPTRNPDRVVTFLCRRVVVRTRTSNGSDGANVRADAATTGFTYPIAEYAHFGSNGNAVTTGPVFRDGRIAGLYGKLIFSDFFNGVPYYLDADNLPNGGSGGIKELRLRSAGTEKTFLAIVQTVNSSATRCDLRFSFDAQSNIYFSPGAVLYYFPDASNPGRYNTNGVRYFYDFATGKVITK